VDHRDQGQLRLLGQGVAQASGSPCGQVEDEALGKRRALVLVRLAATAFTAASLRALVVLAALSFGFRRRVLSPEEAALDPRLSVMAKNDEDAASDDVVGGVGRAVTEGVERCVDLLEAGLYFGRQVLHAVPLADQGVVLFRERGDLRGVRVRPLHGPGVGRASP
jgi:hypothetical protein